MEQRSIAANGPGFEKCSGFINATDGSNLFSKKEYLFVDIRDVEVSPPDGQVDPRAEHDWPPASNQLQVNIGMPIGKLTRAGDQPPHQQSRLARQTHNSFSSLVSYACRSLLNTGKTDLHSLRQFAPIICEKNTSIPTLEQSGPEIAF